MLDIVRKSDEYNHDRRSSLSITSNWSEKVDFMNSDEGGGQM